MNSLFKRVLLSGAAVLALLPWTASAQDVQSDAPQAQQWPQQRRLVMLRQRLNLTEDQKREWARINRETTQKVWAARRDASLNEAQMQAQLRKIHRDQKQQIIALLNPRQQNELKTIWEEQKQTQQGKASSESSGENSNPGSAQSNSPDQDDDLFAGMVSDDPPPQPAQNKKPGQK